MTADTDDERQLSLLKGVRQKGEKPKGPSEFQMQCAVADALGRSAAPGWVWSHFPAGELRTEETGRRLKRMGLKAGWPDFFLISPIGRLYCLELKRPGGRLTEAQAEFRSAMARRSIPYSVAWSVKDAVEILGGWGAVRLTISA
jgi:hypothetical protein